MKRLRLSLRKCGIGVFIAACLVFPVSTLAKDQNAAKSWVRAYAASPSYTNRDAEVTLTNQTIAQTVRLTMGGDKVRLRLSNEHGRQPLRIAKASVLVKTETGVDIVPVTFGGQALVSIPPGAPALSDPVDLQVSAQQEVEIRLYLPEPTLLSTLHWDANMARLSTSGDWTATDLMPLKAIQKGRPILSAVDVLPKVQAATIVAFGDSITDWDCVYGPLPCRWTDVLAQRLQTAGKAYAVANEGIAGNQVLKDGAGLNALARFDRDVLSTPGLAYVILLEGINDIGSSGPNVDATRDSPMVSAEALIAGYQQLIARAHERGIKVYGAEILPFLGAGYASPDKDAIRNEVNQWIRTGAAFDAVIDFSGAVSDPSDPSRLRDDLNTGDHLHPNDAGQAAMGRAIDLNLFQ